MSLNDFALRLTRRSLPSRRVNALKFLPLWIAALVALPNFICAAETNTVSTTNANAEADQQMLRSFLLLQEQLRNTQRAVEQAREEAQADSRRAQEVLAARLNLVEQTLSAQRQRELESISRSTRTVLIVIGTSTVIGFLGVLIAGFMQVRVATRLAEVSRQLQAALPAAHIPQLSAGSITAPTGEPIEASNANLLGAIDRLQHRLEEMETASTTHTATNGHKQITLNAPTNSQLATLLCKGQTLLNLDQPEEALRRFEEAIALEPNSIEAWIKKGTALEKLQRIDEAIAAYDQAIAVDNSTATAYLFKAGVYNRQKKYAEALQCYEKALSAQQKARSSQSAAA